VLGECCRQADRAISRKKTLGARRPDRAKKAAQQEFAAVCWCQLGDGITAMPLFACLRCRSHPDHCAAVRYRVEAAFFRRAEGGFRREMAWFAWRRRKFRDEWLRWTSSASA